MSDGNCLFRSIADQIYGDSNKHSYLRKLVITYMKEHEEYIKLFLDDDDETFDDYVMKMSSDGEWGDNVELFCLSQVCHVNIVVHQVEGPRFVIKYESNDTNDNNNKIAHISYHGECHYNSVRNTDDDDDKPAIDYHQQNFLKSNDNDKSHKNDDDKSNKKQITTKKTKALSKKETRKLKKGINDNINTKNDDNNNVNDNLSKAISEITI